MELIGTLTSYIHPQASKSSNYWEPNEKILHRVGTTMYALGTLSGYRAVAMWKSTNEGVTWTKVTSEYTPAEAGNIYNLDGRVVGTVMYVAVDLDEDTVGYHNEICEFDLDTDTFSAGAGTLPAAIRSTNYIATEVNSYLEVDPGTGEIAVLCRHPTTATDFVLYHGDPSSDTAWTQVTGIGTGTIGFTAIVRSTVPGRLHLFYRSGIDGCFVRTFRVAAGTLSTEVTVAPSPMTIPSGPLSVKSLGDDGVNGEVFLLTGAGGSWGSADAAWRIVSEDVNGDIDAQVDSGVLDTGAELQERWGYLPAVLDPITAGTVHVFHFKLLPSPIRQVIRTSTNYGDTFGGFTAVATDPEVYTFANGMFFERNGSLIHAAMGFQSGAYDDYYEYSFTKLEATIQPISDIVSARWESAPTASQTLFSQVDEVTPSDTDYIYVDL